MSQVKFLKGTQTKFDSLSSFIDGAFYLTEDTDRLYFAQSANECVPLNQFIRTVATLNDLPAANATGLAKGDYYYIENSNVLAICSNPAGTTINQRFTQLNPDTTLQNNMEDVVTRTVSNNAATITTTIKDTANNIETGSVKLVAGNNVTITEGTNDNEINISSTDTNTTYQLKTEATPATGDNRGKAKLTLDASAGSDTSIFIDNKNGSGSDAASGIATISSDANGNVHIYVPPTGIGELSHTIDTDGKLNVSVGTDQGDAIEKSVLPMITLGAADSAAMANATKYKFSNNISTSGAVTSAIMNLPVYTKTEVDSAIEDALGAADAMTFRGTVSSSNASTKLNASTALVGDTYKASSDISTGSVNAKLGDLIIAEGTDKNVTWTVIPSGDDQVISGDIDGNSVIVKDQSGSLVETVFANGNNTTAVVTDNTASGGPAKATVKFNHNARTATVDANNKIGNTTTQRKYIKNITLDGYGHITNVETGQETVQDNDVVEVAMASATTNNGSVYTSTLTTDVITTLNQDGCAHPAHFDVQSSTLKLASTASNGTNNPKLSIDLEWGSF